VVASPRERKNERAAPEEETFLFGQRLHRPNPSQSLGDAGVIQFDTPRSLSLSSSCFFSQ